MMMMMVMRLCRLVTALVFFGLATNAIAGGSALGVQVGSGSGLVGSATPVNIAIGFTNDGGDTVVAIQFDVDFDGASITATPNCAGYLNPVTMTSFVNVNCTMTANSVRVVVDETGNNPIPANPSLVDIDFDISSAAEATYPLTVSAELYFDAAVNPVLPTATTNGEVNVTTGPTPDIGVDPTDLTGFASPVQGFGAPPTADLVITNTGDATTTLTGSCSLTGGGPGITVAPTGALTLGLAQNADTTVTFSCDNTAAIDAYSGSYDCTGMNASSGATLSVPVSCEVTAPGDAEFGSSPIDPGGTIDFDAIVGFEPLADVGDRIVLTGSLLNTAAPGNFDVTNISCSLASGAGPIGIETFPATSIAPQSSTALDFVCDPTGFAAGPYSDDMTCTYDIDNSAAPGDETATYGLQCDLRVGESSVSAGLPDMTPVNITVGGFGGSGTSRAIPFTETNNEGVDGSVSCLLTGGDAGVFTISPASAIDPSSATVVAGTTTNVTVSGTEPGGPVDAQLVCTITDDASAKIGGGSVYTYPLGFNVVPLVVPTLSQWGMILMALSLLGFASYRLRRRTDL